MGWSVAMFEMFRPFVDVRHGLSEKKDGFMNVKTANDPARDAVALENRRRFFEREGATGNIFIPYLVHGSEVRLVSGENWQEMPRADGFVTNTPEIVLTVTVADCFPLYFYDPVRKAIGLAHSGWRGTVKNILGEMVKALGGHFGSRPEDLLLGIGSGIQKCHFSVRDDVLEQFKEYTDLAQEKGYASFAARKGDEHFVDLRGILVRQAEEAGIKRVETVPDCTYCLADKYFSYRRDKPAIPEVMVAYCMLRS